MTESLLTSKCTLVPAVCFDSSKAAEMLREVVSLDSSDGVRSVEIPQFGAVLIYSDKDIISGGHSDALPEMFYVLGDIAKCREYNKIVVSYCDSLLHLAIAGGEKLLFANTFKAQDFTTAEYFIFLTMKSLQLNPEISTIYLRTPVGLEEEMSLYRYFKFVEHLCE